MVRILITGASSSVGVAITRRLLKQPDVEIWCGRHQTPIDITDNRLQVIDLDLESDLHAALSGREFDMVIHCAAITHAVDERRYWPINVDATTRLAGAVRANGCRNVVFISTRCATAAAGVYGASKLAAEQELQKFDWESLLIIRPAEIYGANSREGIDEMIATACKWRVVPALFGDSHVRFAPIHIDDFGRLATELILRRREGVNIEHLCGPEDLTGGALALRISRHCGALPVPIWWPLIAVTIRTLHRLGFSKVKPDQLKRLIGKKTATAESSKTNSAGLRRFLLQR
jgi:nucleoside-diphosphate-sugar epimerase